MARGSSTEAILYGVVGSRGQMSAEEQAIVEVVAAMSEQQRSLLLTFFQLEESDIEWMDLYDERARWDLSLIAFQMRGSASKGEREQTAKLLKSVQRLGLLNTRRYGGIKRVRWRLSERGETAHDLYQRRLLIA